MRIIYGNHRTANIFKVIEKNLEYHGFEVINVVYDHKFKPKTFLSYLSVKLNRLFGDKKLKKRLENEAVNKFIEEKLSNIDESDYALLFSGHNYDHKALELIKQKTTKRFANFQQDGIDRYPDILERITYFDSFYVSDPLDLAKGDNFMSATNFYFDYALENNEEIKYDFYFVGSHIKNRQAAIQKFSQYAKDNGLAITFNILCKKRNIPLLKREYNDQYINLISSIISYEDNLKLVKQSRVLVDFVVAEHNVLSYRVFEALGYKKKLITTNQTVRYYDFYHPDNIFIWNGKDLDGLNEFLSKPYFEIDNSIREKYSFGNWIKYILDIVPHQKIELPLENA